MDQALVEFFDFFVLIRIFRTVQVDERDPV